MVVGCGGDQGECGFFFLALTRQVAYKAPLSEANDCSADSLCDFYDELESELAEARRQLAEAQDALDDDHADHMIERAKMDRALDDAQREEDAAWDEADRWHDRAVYAGRVLLDLLDFLDAPDPDGRIETFDRLPEWARARLEA